MGRIHLLPGTTFSNLRERKDYPSEDEAALTLTEFEHWLAVEVSERYHRNRHRGLGATPLSVWEQAISRGAHQALPADPKLFRLSFLPLEYRQSAASLCAFSMRSVHHTTPIGASMRWSMPP